jgi:hypothetical protein
MGESLVGRPPAPESERAIRVADILSEIIEMFREYELPEWARALESDRMRLLAGDDDVYWILRRRLSVERGLSDVRVGFGDRALNSRLDELRNQLRALIAEQELEPERDAETETQFDLAPAEYGERIEREPPPRGVRVIFAADYPRGTLVHDGNGLFARSTWSVLEYDERRRLRPLVRIWRYSEPVSIEEYRSLRRACIGWWITLGAVPALVVGAGVAGLRSDVLSILFVIAGILTPAAAVMVGVMERRRSKVVAVYSEKTGALVVPVSRGSRLHLPGRASTDETSGAPASSTRSDTELDERMLRRLRVRPTSGSPSTWVIFLSCGNQTGAEIMAAAVVRDGWELRYAGPESSSGRWTIIAERDVTTLESRDVHDARTYFERLATTVDAGHYDGWQLDD